MEDELLYQYLKDTGWDEAHLLNESFGADFGASHLMAFPMSRSGSTLTAKKKSDTLGKSSCGFCPWSPASPLRDSSMVRLVHARVPS